jgi:uncharacterized protein
MTGRTGDRIPSRSECDELMAQYSMLPNIVQHSLQVMRVSLAITDNLQSGVQVNRNLVMAASLLHDITKTKSLQTREHHDASGGELLRELGFPSVAEIVEQHVIMQTLYPSGRLEEREIVYYADKRVLHATIVTLDERVDDLIKRYGSTAGIRNQILQNKIQALTVEKKIAGLMAIDLCEALRAARAPAERVRRLSTT